MKNCILPFVCIYLFNKYLLPGTMEGISTNNNMDWAILRITSGDPHTFHLIAEETDRHMLHNFTKLA
jgi:hypothetical protein